MGQGKIKSYKKQIEEAEEIAALNLPSTGRPRTALPMPLSVPTPTSRPSPRTVLGLAAPPLDLCKRKLNRTGCRVSIYNAKDLLSAKAQHYLMFPNPYPILSSLQC